MAKSSRYRHFPGSIVFRGDKRVEKVQLHKLRYSADSLTESVLDNHSQIVLSESDEATIDWYDIRGVHDVDLIKAFGKNFNIHPLILDEVTDTHRRPKFKEYKKGIFVIARALSYDEKKREINTEQVAIYFREGLVISFQEGSSDLFQSVRDRIQNAEGRVRNSGSDYLCYALIDDLVDQYFILLEGIEESINEIEKEIAEGTDERSLEKIHGLKREMIKVKKNISPLREAISRFVRSENPLIKEASITYIRDLNDHTIQVMDMVETYRDTMTGLQDLYMSTISYKINQVMKFLTIITTIFVPLSFLAALYGMNFDNMPELRMQNAYFVLLTIMIMIFVGSLIYFKRKKWF